MKHIKKRFLEIANIDNIPIDKSKGKYINDIKKEKDFLTILKTDEDKNFLGFMYRDKKTQQNLIINFPILPMVFYDNAYHNYRISSQQRDAVISKIANFGNGGSFPEHEIYNFVGYSTSSIIMLCVALESFANEIIAHSKYEYKIETSKRTEIYNHIQTQNEIDFKTKLFKVIPNCLKKFPPEKSLFKSKVITLIDFRNKLVHLKSVDSGKESFIFQSELLRLVLGFDYIGSLTEVRNYMNFFRKDYIMDCDCDKDF